MAYTPTVWVSGVAPAIDATNLNHLETQYAQALADIPEDAAAGTPSERTLGTGPLQSAAGDHIHTLQQESEDSDHAEMVIGQHYNETGDNPRYTSLTTSLITYTDRASITFTPAAATHAIVCSYTAWARNGTATGVEDPSSGYDVQLLYDGTVRSSVSMSLPSGTGSDAESELWADTFTEISPAASSTIVKTRTKVHSVGGGHTHHYWDAGFHLFVTEISV